MIDERTRAALARLTANEKECLRRRLRHQTAKEMAIDLGISPHAVEKRLKMARAKLGLPSSLEAARLLAAAEERYGSPAPEPTDLGGRRAGGEAVHGAVPPPKPAWRRYPSVLAGASFMTLVIAVLIAMLPQSAPSDSGGKPVDGRGNAVPVRRTDMNEAAAFLAEGFRSKDSDRSGFLDDSEVSTLEPRDAARDKSLPPSPPAGAPDPAAVRKWMAKLDTDRDDRVSEAEYVAYMMPWILWQGVPTGWKPAGH